MQRPDRYPSLTGGYSRDWKNTQAWQMQLAEAGQIFDLSGGFFRDKKDTWAV
jgi:hypothetical protein